MGTRTWKASAVFAPTGCSRGACGEPACDLNPFRPCAAAATDPHGSATSICPIPSVPRLTQVTALSFDKNERRLVTAANDATIRMWNFNNGSLLRRRVLAQGTRAGKAAGSATQG
jgi:hypothetical protein